jgi:hypothetical protein
LALYREALQFHFLLRFSSRRLGANTSSRFLRL